MASRTEYEMLFALNATMNGNFTGTFTKAQSEFSRLGKEIQELHKVQSDISSFQKQQTAVENTRGKLDNLRQQHDLLQKEIDETTGSTTELEREKLKLEQRIKDTEAALQRQEEKLTATGQRLKDAGVDTDNLAEKDAELTRRVKELSEEQEKAAGSSQSFGEKASAALDAVSNTLVATGIVAGVKKLAEEFAECVRTAAAFEEQMSTVEALSGASAAEMAALNAQAKELGATTKYTATESGQAMEYMAMAGWDAQQMLDGMPSVLNLAAASGEDLAQVADIVTDALTAFGLKASDTGYFADVLATAATSANTNVGMMGETFKYAAPLAGALGYSVKDVATMIGLMANSGIKGTQAGTALRTMFSKLTDGAKLTSRNFGEVTVETQNADGTMKGLSEVITELRERFSQMTEAEKMMNAETLVGKFAMSGFVALMNASNGDFEKLYGNIENCSGAAKRMADIKMDNLNGDLTLMKSAWDAVSNSIGSLFLPEARGATGVLTEIANITNGFIQDNPELAKGIATITAAVVGATAAITAFAAAAKVVKALELGSSLIKMGPIVAGVAAMVIAAAEGIAYLSAAAKEGVPTVEELTEATQGLNEALDAGAEAYEGNVDSALASANAADHYIDKLDELRAAGLQTEEQQQEYQNTLAILLQTMPSLADSIGVTTDQYGRSIYSLNTSTDALRANTEAVKENAVAQARQEYMTEMYSKYAATLVEAQKNSIGLSKAENDLAEAKAKQAEVEKRMAEYVKQNGKPYNWTGRVDGVYQAMQNEWAGYENQIQKTEASIENYKTAIKESEDATAAADEELRAMEEALGLVSDGTSSLTLVQQDAMTAIGGVMGEVQSLTTAYDEAYTAASKSFEGQFGLFDEAKVNMDSTVQAAQKALDSQLEYWQNYSANIEILRGKSAEDLEDLGLIKENYDALMSYVRSGTPEAAGLAASMVKEINKGNSQAVAELGNTIAEVQKARDQAAKEVADWTSGLSEQLDGLVTDMGEQVNNLNMSDEAADAAYATIKSYIDQLGGMEGEVRRAYHRVAVAGLSGLGGTKTGRENSAYWNAYATGTTSAEAGWAVVGENGPEAVLFRGGETVLNADRTAQALGGGSYTVTVAPTYNIDGGADGDRLQNILEQNNDALRDMILGVMEDASTDARRMAYT